MVFSASQALSLRETKVAQPKPGFAPISAAGLADSRKRLVESENRRGSGSLI